jgi:hypothetical protein
LLLLWTTGSLPAGARVLHPPEIAVVRRAETALLLWNGSDVLGLSGAASVEFCFEVATGSDGASRGSVDGRFLP